MVCDTTTSVEAFARFLGFFPPLKMEALDFCPMLVSISVQSVSQKT